VIKDGVDLADAIDRWVLLRSDRVYEVGTPTRQLRADDVAANALAKLCQRATGTALPAGMLAPPAFSIATVIQMDGITAAPIQEADPIHRYIEALAHPLPAWRRVTLPALAGSTLRTKSAPPGHVLYARDHARVVWQPSYASADSERPNRLSCYHRNLTFATMQTEVLASATAAAIAATRAGAVLDPAQEDCVRASADLLGRLYAGQQSYRTSSVHEQIDHHAGKPDINVARQLFNMAPL
jgi:hypothetical protein